MIEYQSRHLNIKANAEFYKEEDIQEELSESTEYETSNKPISNQSQQRQ